MCSHVMSEVTNRDLPLQVGHAVFSKANSGIYNSPVVEPSFEGEMVHLGPNFVDGMSLALETAPALLASQVLQTKVSRVYQTTRKFDFNTNGFEFKDFAGSLLGKAIEKLATGPVAWQDIPESTIDEHSAAVEVALSDWGKAVGIQFSKVVWIDTVYRNTAAGRFGAVHFVHVDFPSEDYKETLKGHDTWKERVVKKLGPLTKEEYEGLDVNKIINIWMPLDEKIEAEPLAMMDLESLKHPKKDLRVYQDTRISNGTAYPSIGVFPSVEQRWYTKEGMKRGEAVVFDSCKTPHSAVSLPTQGTKGRRSVESRVLFLK